MHQNYVGNFVLIFCTLVLKLESTRNSVTHLRINRHFDKKSLISRKIKIFNVHFIRLFCRPAIFDIFRKTKQKKKNPQFSWTITIVDHIYVW